jgi:hypothetical protein
MVIKKLKGFSKIYQIENNENLKSYVVSFINIRKRLIKLINKAKNIVRVKGNYHFYKAINKHDF